jgi:hypothetical protein
MRIPGADEAIEHGLLGGAGGWKEECMRAIAAHFEPVCAKSGISEEACRCTRRVYSPCQILPVL